MLPLQQVPRSLRVSIPHLPVLLVYGLVFLIVRVLHYKAKAAVKAEAPLR